MSFLGWKYWKATQMDDCSATLELPFAGETPSEDMIDVALQTVREHLGMEVAYLSEFVDGRAVFRAVSAPGLDHLIKPGDSQDLQDVYCQHILDGRLPRLIPDTSLEPLAVSLPITQATPIGSHVSVPIHRRDGTVYGMFCCLSPRPNPTLNQRDLKVMETFAGLAARQLDSTLAQRSQRDAAVARIDAALRRQSFHMAFQPIFEIDAPRPCGFEALCRFESDPYRSPDKWFDEARQVDRAIELELCVIAAALKTLPVLPPHITLSVNASPATVTSGRLADAFADHPLERIVVEVTEHAIIDDYDGLIRELRLLAFRGVSIAIDDVGAGYSGLSHILKLRPDIIKLDLALIRSVDTDMARQSLVKAMVHFADQTAARVIAEGVETRDELAKLRDLGVHRCQGYLLGKPANLCAALSWFDKSTACTQA